MLLTFNFCHCISGSCRWVWKTNRDKYHNSSPGITVIISWSLYLAPVIIYLALLELTCHWYSTLIWIWSVCRAGGQQQCDAFWRVTWAQTYCHSACVNTLEHVKMKLTACSGYLHFNILWNIYRWFWRRCWAPAMHSALRSLMPSAAVCVIHSITSDLGLGKWCFPPL